MLVVDRGTTRILHASWHYLQARQAHLKRRHRFPRQLALIENANFESALLIETQANSAFGMPRSLDPGGLASVHNNWLGSEH